MKLYKLTDENGRTYNSTQWGPGVTHSGTGEGYLCGPGWIHAYTDPLLAVLLNPIHGEFERPRLWECKGKVAKTDHGLKVGCRTLATLRELPLPEVTREQRVRFGILCAKRVCNAPTWNCWADAWLDGSDRSTAAAQAAEAAAVGVGAARAAAWAAWASEAARAAAWAVEWAAQVAEAVVAAAWAVERAATETTELPLAEIAREAVAQ